MYIIINNISLVSKELSVYIYNFILMFGILYARGPVVTV